MSQFGDRMRADNLYRRIFDDAQRLRRQHDVRLTAQIRRIEEKANHGDRAQEQRKEPQP